MLFRSYYVPISNSTASTKKNSTGLLSEDIAIALTQQITKEVLLTWSLLFLPMTRTESMRIHSERGTGFLLTFMIL